MVSFRSEDDFYLKEPAAGIPIVFFMREPDGGIIAVWSGDLEITSMGKAEHRDAIIRGEYRKRTGASGSETRR